MEWAKVPYKFSEADENLYNMQADKGTVRLESQMLY